MKTHRPTSGSSSPAAKTPSTAHASRRAYAWVIVTEEPLEPAIVSVVAGGRVAAEHRVAELITDGIQFLGDAPYRRVRDDATEMLWENDEGTVIRAIAAEVLPHSCGDDRHERVSPAPRSGGAERCRRRAATRDQRARGDTSSRD